MGNVALHGLMSVTPVAIDTDALKKDSSKFVDRYTASRLFPRSSWKHRKMKDVMSILDDDMTQSRKALGGLDLRSLVRPNWSSFLHRTSL